jgi:hypothetical protein
MGSSSSSSSSKSSLPAEPLPLPSWQQGFDAEKFRRAQIDLGAQQEAKAHAGDSFGMHQHSSRFSSATSPAATARSVDVQIIPTTTRKPQESFASAGAAISSGNTTARSHHTPPKGSLSQDDEALLDDLLNDN